MSLTVVQQQQNYEELVIALQKLGIPNGPDGKVFDIQFRPNRGLCAIALSDTVKGTAVLAEAPLFSINSISLGSEPLTAANVIDINNAAIGHREFATLSCAQNPPTPSRRFQTNSLEMGDGTTQGIFIEAARFNHSCTPNAYFSWNADLRCLTIHAINKIRQGAEILVNYIPRDAYRTRRQRHEKLNDYEFTCTCRACQEGTAFQELSRKRRIEMGQLSKKVDEQRNRRNPIEEDRQLFQAIKLKSLLRCEGIVYPQQSDACGKLAIYFERELRRRIENGETYANSSRVGTCRDEILLNMREKLVLDVMSTGHYSPEVREYLNWIREFKGRHPG